MSAIGIAIANQIRNKGLLEQRNAKYASDLLQCSEQWDINSDEYKTCVEIAQLEKQMSENDYNAGEQFQHLNDGDYWKTVKVEYQTALSECHDNHALGSKEYNDCVSQANDLRIARGEQRKEYKQESGANKRPATNNLINPYKKIKVAMANVAEAAENAGDDDEFNENNIDFIGLAAKLDRINNCQTGGQPKEDYTCEQKHHYFKCLAKGKLECWSDNFICVDGKPTYDDDEKAKFACCMKRKREECKS